MGAVLLLAPVVRRRYDVMAALALSAFVMSLVDPDVLQDAGFQLSFGAMLGIALVAPRIMALSNKIKVPRPVAGVLATGLGAQLFTLPLLAILTGRVSLVSSFATFAVEFTLLPLMIVGTLAGIAGTFILPLGQALGLLVWPAAAWMVQWVRFWASLPWASVDLPVQGLFWVVAYYAALALALWLPSRWSLVSARLKSLRFAPAALACLGGGLWVALLIVVLR